MPIDTTARTAAVFAFGPYRLVPSQRLVLRGSTPLQLGSRAREILLALVQRAGEVVEKRDLLRRVWPGTVVEETTLRVHINTLRKALREGEAGIRYVESITGRGYRFVAPVLPVEESGQLFAPPAATPQKVLHACSAGRALLAFVHVDTRSPAGMRQLVELKELPEVEEIHAVTGASAMLLKVRARDTQALYKVLERVYAIEGVAAARSCIALSTYLERGPNAAND